MTCLQKVRKLCPASLRINIVALSISISQKRCRSKSPLVRTCVILAVDSLSVQFQEAWCTKFWKQLLPADLGGRGSVGSQTFQGPAWIEGKKPQVKDILLAWQVVQHLRQKCNSRDFGQWSKIHQKQTELLFGRPATATSQWTSIISATWRTKTMGRCDFLFCLRVGFSV